ncbi:hypothetical protein ACIPUB_17845 [Paeniglutamicibacter sp. ORCA_105]|uniref:hypothetical protein n=1 Tax=Paeniglutamicibacter sp. ORCA_105 TaxID=3377336 RepID=UPI00389339EA
MKSINSQGRSTRLRGFQGVKMNPSWLIRGASFGAGVLLLTGVLVPIYAHDSNASWSDSQTASATMKALVVPIPANTKCTSSNTPLGGPVATTSWSPASSIGGSIVGYKIVGKQQLSDPEWTFIVEPTSNSYEFKTGLLAGILGTVLKALLGSGSEFHVGVVAVHSFQGVAWESAVAPIGKITKAQGGTLNLISGFACL